MSDIISVSSLVKRFGTLTAVNEINFRVGEGELFAFLGPNGAGKSTTINMLCTLLEKDGGEVEVLGYRIGRDDRKIRRGIGVVFQDNSLDDLLTVKQNLISRAYLYETEPKKIRQNFDHVCSVLQLGELLHRPFGKLSGGQKRRCEIGRALMNSPKLLFLDEPTTGLDPQTRYSVWECIELLRRDLGTAVFLTTHYMEEASRATNIAIIDEGKTAAQGTPTELRERFSSDLLKIDASDAAGIKSYFAENNIPFTEKEGGFQVKVAGSLKALEYLETVKKFVASFEVVHGTMDDVFLNITGKDLREL